MTLIQIKPFHSEMMYLNQDNISSITRLKADERLKNVPEYKTIIALKNGNSNIETDEPLNDLLNRLEGNGVTLATLPV